MRAPRSQRQWARLAPGTWNLIFTPEKYIYYLKKNESIVLVLLKRMKVNICLH